MARTGKATRTSVDVYKRQGMLAALLAFSPSIVKANLYDFSYQSLPFLSPVFATGSFTTSDTLIPDIDVYGDSGYKIIGITGERNGCLLYTSIIIGSTRPGRNGEAVAKWVYQIAQKRSDAEFELVDIKDFNLPLLDEPVPSSMGQYLSLIHI